MSLTVKRRPFRQSSSGALYGLPIHFLSSSLERGHPEVIIGNFSENYFLSVVIIEIEGPISISS